MYANLQGYFHSPFTMFLRKLRKNCTDCVLYVEVQILSRGNLATFKTQKHHTYIIPIHIFTNINIWEILPILSHYRDDRLRVGIKLLSKWIQRHSKPKERFPYCTYSHERDYLWIPPPPSHSLTLQMQKVSDYDQNSADYEFSGLQNQQSDIRICS